MPGYPCCCDKPCECLCVDCVDGFAPCCWTVTIDGFSENSCVACQTLDKTYFLPQADDGSSYTEEGCSWISGEVCGPPAITEILLTVFQEGSDYIIEVTLGDHVWSKNYGTSKPNCCSLTNEILPNTATVGDCDASSVTCTISARSDALSCVTPPCSNVPCNCTCDKFCAEAAPCCIVATISGLSNGSCGDCGDLNTSFTMGQTADGACTWSHTIDPSICGIASIDAELYLDAGDYKLKITLGDHVWEHNFGTTKPDCATFASETYNRTGSNTVCDGSSATISLSVGCPALSICRCDNWPFEWAVDFGVGGWVTATCSYCEQVAGVFVVRSDVPLFVCVAELNDDVCIGENGWDGLFFIGLELLTSAGSVVFWELIVRINHVSGGNRRNVYRSATWDLDDDSECFKLADLDGKIALTSVLDSGSLFPQSPCPLPPGGSLPTTIHIWDANA